MINPLKRGGPAAPVEPTDPEVPRPFTAVAKPELTGGRRIGVLLQHGFTGSPVLHEAVGSRARRAGVRRRGAAAAGSRHAVAGAQHARVEGLVRRDVAGLREAPRRERRGRRGRPLDGRLAGAAPRGRPPRRRGRDRAGQPGRQHRAARRPGAARPQVAGAVVPRHRQRHQEARRRGARLLAHAAQGGRLDDARGLEAAARGPGPDHLSAAVVQVDRRPRRRPDVAGDHPEQRVVAGLHRADAVRELPRGHARQRRRRRSSTSPPSSSPGSPQPTAAEEARTNDPLQTTHRRATVGA